MATDYSERNAMISFTVTTEYVLDDDFESVAKAMGVSMKKLAAIIDDGEDYEPSDTAITRLQKRGTVENEKFDISDITDGW